MCSHSQATAPYIIYKLISTSWISITFCHPPSIRHVYNRLRHRYRTSSAAGQDLRCVRYFYRSPDSDDKLSRCRLLTASAAHQPPPICPPPQVPKHARRTGAHAQCTYIYPRTQNIHTYIHTHTHKCTNIEYDESVLEALTTIEPVGPSS